MSTSTSIDNFDLNQTCALSRDGRWLFVLGTGALWELRSDSGLDRPALRDAAGIEIKNAEFSGGGDFLILYASEHLLLVNRVSNEGATLDTNQQPVRYAFFTGDDRWVIAECGTDTAGDPAAGATR